jgi:hypothetical protein
LIDFDVEEDVYNCNIRNKSEGRTERSNKKLISISPPSLLVGREGRIESRINEKRGRKNNSNDLPSTIKHNESAIQLSDDYMSVCS